MPYYTSLPSISTTFSNVNVLVVRVLNLAIWLLELVLSSSAASQRPFSISLWLPDMTWPHSLLIRDDTEPPNLTTILAVGNKKNCGGLALW